MVIWHNTEDAPRTPAEVFQNDKVVLWIGSYPIEPGQSIVVEVSVSGKSGDSRNIGIEAEWRYNDYSRNNSYWTAIIGPFKAGESVEYKIVGSNAEQLKHTQVDRFEVIDRRKPEKK